MCGRSDLGMYAAIRAGILEVIPYLAGPGTVEPAEGFAVLIENGEQTGVKFFRGARDQQYYSDPVDVASEDGWTVYDPLP